MFRELGTFTSKPYTVSSEGYDDGPLFPDDGEEHVSMLADLDPDRGLLADLVADRRGSALAELAEPTARVQPFAEPPPAHSLSVCSWNSLELRLGDLKSKADDPSDEADLKRQYWLEFIKKLTDFDVIVMQEIPASEFAVEKRTRKICEWLHQYSEPEVTWNMYFSDPSGKDGKTRAPRPRACVLGAQSTEATAQRR